MTGGALVQVLRWAQSHGGRAGSRARLDGAVPDSTGYGDAVRAGRRAPRHLCELAAPDCGIRGPAASRVMPGAIPGLCGHMPN